MKSIKNIKIQFFLKIYPQWFLSAQSTLVQANISTLKNYKNYKNFNFFKKYIKYTITLKIQLRPQNNQKHNLKKL